jgi:hypothetical protein
MVGGEPKMKPKLPWNAIRFVWEIHFVETRLFCRELDIDRTWLQERIKKYEWQGDNALTIAQMEKLFSEAQAAGNHARAAEIHANIRIRRSTWAMARAMLRLMMGKDDA